MCGGCRSTALWDTPSAAALYGELLGFYRQAMKLQPPDKVSHDKQSLEQSSGRQSSIVGAAHALSYHLCLRQLRLPLLSFRWYC